MQAHEEKSPSPEEVIFLDFDGTGTLINGETLFKAFPTKEALLEYIKSDEAKEFKMPEGDTKKLTAKDLMAPGFIPMLKELIALGRPVIIVSSNHTEVIEEMLKKGDSSNTALTSDEDELEKMIIGREETFDRHRREVIQKCMKDKGYTSANYFEDREQEPPEWEKNRYKEAGITLHTAKPGKFNWERDGIDYQIVMAAVKANPDAKKEAKIIPPASASASSEESAASPAPPVMASAASIDPPLEVSEPDEQQLLDAKRGRAAFFDNSSLNVDIPPSPSPSPRDNKPKASSGAPFSVFFPVCLSSTGAGDRSPKSISRSPSPEEDDIPKASSEASRSSSSSSSFPFPLCLSSVDNAHHEEPSPPPSP